MGNIDFVIHKKTRFVHFKGTGDISCRYLMERIQALHRHPDFDFSFNSFIDFKNAAIPLVDDWIDSYQPFFAALQKAGIHRKWAIYTEDDTTFQNANMSHLLQTGAIEVDVFQNRETALASLGITQDDLRAP